MASSISCGVDSHTKRQDLTYRIGTGDTMGSNTLDQRSPFFNLSPELRNRIYFDVLVHAEVEVDYDNIFNKTSLLRVCSQIRNECLQIFYTQNRFVISNTSTQAIHFKHFLSAAVRDNPKGIGHIRFCLQKTSRITELLQIEQRARSGAITQADMARQFEAIFGGEGIASAFDALQKYLKDEHKYLGELEDVLKGHGLHFEGDQIKASSESAAKQPQ